MTRRRVVLVLILVAVVVAVVLVVRAGGRGEQPAGGQPAPGEMTLESPVLQAGARMPVIYTADGENVSPPLRWKNVPEGTLSLALVMEDPDAPVGTFVHWLVCDMSPSTDGLREGVRRGRGVPGTGGIQGSNSARELGYMGPAPPEGETHRYFFRLYALDTKLEIPAAFNKQQLMNGMQGHILAKAELMVRYGRPETTGP